MPSIKQERDRLAREMERLAAREAKAREAGLARLEKLRAKHARETVRLCQKQGREVEALCKKLGISVAMPACGGESVIRLRYKPFEGWSARLGAGAPVLVRDTDDSRILRAYSAFRKLPLPEDFNNRAWFAVSDEGDPLG